MPTHRPPAQLATARRLLPLALALLLLAPALLLLAPALPAGADAGWKGSEGYEELQEEEVDVLSKLLKRARKEGYARQAWYFADRILKVDPDDRDALETMEEWSVDELLRSEPLGKRFLKRRAKALRELGDEIFHFGETLEAAGVDPVDYYEINQRAHAYGSEAGPLVNALRSAGYLWLGTFLERETSAVQEVLGPELAGAVDFPPEFDDGYLHYRPLWPAARVARWGRWRIVTGGRDWKDELRTVRLVAELDDWLVGTVKKRRTKDEVTDLVVFPDIETYDRVGVDYVRERHVERFRRRSLWYSHWRRRALVSAGQRDNPWVPPEAMVKGAVGRVLARTRLSNAAGGFVGGRGAWLLDGVRGVFEGLVRREGGFALDPAACWRLAAARALRDADQLLSWEELYDLDWNGMRDVPRVRAITVHVNGVAREAQNVDVVAAQATALAAGVFLSDREDGPEDLATLVEELFKRDMLPDCDKTLRWKRGRVVEEANAAMDRVPVPE